MNLKNVLKIMANLRKMHLQKCRHWHFMTGITIRFEPPLVATIMHPKVVQKCVECTTLLVGALPKLYAWWKRLATCPIQLLLQILISNRIRIAREVKLLKEW